MFTKNQISVVVRITLVIAFFAGMLGVQPVRAASVNFGWAKGMGGSGSEAGYNITTDGVGNVYVTGPFEGTVDFDPGLGTSNLTSAGGRDIYICKLDENGNLIWVRGMGGGFDDAGLGIVSDNNGNIYITGYFRGTVDFDPGTGITNLTSVGENDIFILRLDSSGNFVWAKSMGGLLNDAGVDIDLDSTNGYIYLTGNFFGVADFDPGTGTNYLTSKGEGDIFVSKFDGNGNFVWAEGIGGTLNDRGLAITVAGSHVYLTGSFQDMVDFDPGAGITNLISAGGSDVFIAKYYQDGNFVWAKGMGGASNESGNEIALDGNGNLFTTGEYEGLGDFDPGPGTVNLTNAGASDVFINKLDSDGNFVWAKGIGGFDYDAGTSIAVDVNGYAYIVGYFYDTVDFDPGVGVTNITSVGSSDIFVSKYDGGGNLIWARSIGGPSFDGSYDIVLDGSGHQFITGDFTGSVDFDPGPGTSNLISQGESDIFVTKLTFTPQIHYVKWNATGANNGLSWVDAYTDLQSALSTAQSGDEIWVAAGTYRPTSGADRTVSFVLKNGVAVYGGFAGIETQRDQRDFVTNVTVLSGEIGGAGIADNSYHVVVGSGVDNSAVLDGFLVTKGNVYDLSDPYVGDPWGGGMYVLEGGPDLSNLIFTANSARSGGGIALDNSYSILSNVTFQDNLSESAGGALVVAGAPTFKSVIFNGNDADFNGGGMAISNSNPVLENVTFSGNA
jgi:hypothetical protein